ncbi:MAG TPA: ATP-binding protein [Gammaproteobacteria bacterium]|nr:ATP-binding protein [Gammaproteobacteria bacterium]
MQIITRNLEQELLTMAASYPVVTLLGPRQSGKTTLIKQVFPQKPYITLEDPDERSFAYGDPRGFLQRFPNGAILDEIQRLPKILSFLQGIIDNIDTKGLFILTGSHQLSLHESISQSLAGRTAVLKLLPFTMQELAKEHKEFSLHEYIFQGMYPRIYKDNLNPTKFYRDYVQTYVERDVRQMVNVKDLTLFQQFLKLCAGRIGQVLNSHSLSNDLGVSYHTVSNWLSILEASFLIFRLAPYFENFGKRMIKSPKLYFTDVGLASYLLDITSVQQIVRDPLLGNLVENLVISEFIKYRLNAGFEPGCYFYRDSNQHEVDLLFKSGQQLIPIEIKASQTFHPQFLKNLEYFKRLVHDRCEQGFLIYAGEQEQRIGHFQVINFRHVAQMVNKIQNI